MCRDQNSEQCKVLGRAQKDIASHLLQQNNCLNGYLYIISKNLETYKNNCLNSCRHQKLVGGGLSNKNYDWEDGVER